MLAAVDADYRADRTIAACVCFERWSDAAPASSHVERLPPAAPYEPGKLYLRELPGVLAVLRRAGPVEVVIIDGYVWLGEDAPGFGAHLFEALGRGVAVVGVAKTRYRGTEPSTALLRGGSAQPLYVTAAGMPPAEAAAHVAEMHGPHRIPTLLRAVDRLARASEQTP